MERIFGLDIGSTSVGFAVVDYDRQGSEGRILRMGVRIFPEARDPKGVPFNQHRREKRMMRRQLRRRRQRRRLLNEALHSAGFLPRYGADDWAKTMKLDPYALRKRALEERLTPFELGRAIYHLAKRRHFRGRPLEGDQETAESVDEKAAESDRESTRKAIRASGKTLGAWLADSEPGRRKRGIHAQRDLVEEEFDYIWERQKEFYDSLKDSEFHDRIRNIIFSQRPVFWRKNTLGECPLIPGAELCPKGFWLSAQRRMLEKLNNLAIVGAGARPLDSEEREAILMALQSKVALTWPGVRRVLKKLYAERGQPGEEKRLKFNLEIGGERELPGNWLEAKLAKIFGSAWEDHSNRQAIRDAVQKRLWDADYHRIADQRVEIRSPEERAVERRRAAETFINDFGVSPDTAAELEELQFPSGWEPYSTEALRRILPKLEEGVRFGALIAGPEWEAWREENFPDRQKPTGEICDRLPSPAGREERQRLRGIRNPTVARCQNELRKVVNNLIDVHGKPDRVRIELTRDVGQSRRDRDEHQAAIKRQEVARRRAIADLQENGIDRPSRDEITKWLLWKESDEQCPYTGDQIGFDDLFRTGEYEIEHIWPRSRSLDNSFLNKTLCRRDINLAKGNMTPYEYLGRDTDKWHAMQDRLTGMMRGKGRKEGMAPAKVKRFMATEIPDDFAQRQLNDTGYAARESVKMLKRLWPDSGPEAPVTVQAVSGRVVAQLRRFWGLNNLLHEEPEKNRADHRHHAVDALVVACVHPGITQSLSRYWQRLESTDSKRPALPLPWFNIRRDAAEMLEKVVVSHRVRKKVSGPLHEEMPFGYAERDITKKGTRLGVFVKRKPVEELSLATLRVTEVEEISRNAKFVVPDTKVREAIRAHLEASGGDPKKAYKNGYPRLTPDGPEIRKVRVLTTQQKKLMVPAMNGFVDPANNHHIAIYRLPDGKTDCDVVTLYEAARRLSRRESVVRRTRNDGAAFAMSFSKGDGLKFSDGEQSGLWIVQGVWANGQIVLERHTDAVSETTIRRNPGAILKNGGRKVSVDPIGRVRVAND